MERGIKTLNILETIRNVRKARNSRKDDFTSVPPESGIHVMNKGESGVFLGIHPKEKLPLISSDEKNVLLVAPTRSGKGVNTVIPTGII